MENNEPLNAAPSAPPRRPAATADILGGRAKRRPVPPQWSEHYRLLIHLRGQLLKNKQTLLADAQEVVPDLNEHTADAATESYDRDWALSLLSSGQELLCEIEQALARIAQGTYGLCELTGQPIEAERLVTIPWTRFSLDAQLDLETKGAVSRVQFAQRGVCVPAPESEEEGAEPAPAAGDKESA